MFPALFPIPRKLVKGQLDNVLEEVDLGSSFVPLASSILYCVTTRKDSREDRALRKSDGYSYQKMVKSNW
jgi:hypothetical protein